MLSATTNENQIKLNKVLIEISDAPFENDSDIQEYALQLINIYRGGFRHQYSAFFPIVKEVYEKDRIEYLTTNLTSILELCEKKRVEGCKDFSNQETLGSIIKLCDHINLEAARLTYSGSHGDVFAELSDKSAGIKKEQQKISEALNETRKELKSVHTYTVAVLSIFAAIVIAFSGSLSLLGNVISSVSTAPILKLLLIIFACGIVLLNTIAVLMFLVGKITGRDLSSKCENEDCFLCKDKKGKVKCRLIKRASKRIPFLFWLNLIFIVSFCTVAILLVLQHFNVIT